MRKVALVILIQVSLLAGYVYAQDFSVQSSAIRFDSRLGIGIGPYSHSAQITAKANELGYILKLLRDSATNPVWPEIGGITRDGAFVTNGWFLSSGTAQRDPPGVEPYNFGAVTDIYGPAFYGKTKLVGSWFAQLNDHNDITRYLVDWDGCQKWGITGTGKSGLDVSLCRDAANRLKTEGLKLTDLTGTGNAYACIAPNGTLFRSSTPCV